MLRLRKILFLALIFVFNQLQYGVSLFAQSPLGFTVDVQSGCSPLIVSFSTDSINYNSFEWNFGDGSKSTLVSPQHVYTNSGTYTVSLIASLNGGVNDTITKQNLISIHNKPEADFNLGASSLCQQDEALVFTNLSSNYLTCYWDFGDGTTSTAINPMHAYALAGTYNISLIVYDGNGCYDSKELMNAITVNSKPSGNISISANSTCDENELFAFSFSNNNINSYLWNFGDGTTSSLATPAHIFGTNGFFDVELITQNAIGCIDTTYLSSPIVVNENPVPNIILSDSIVCVPGDVHAISNATNVEWMNWTTSNGYSSNLIAPSLSFSVAGNITIQLNVEYQNGCTNHSTSNVLALPTPDPVYSMVSPSGCAPNTVQFVNLTTGSYNWNWDFGDSTYSVAGNPDHTYLEAGLFFPKLTATDANGCAKNYVSPGVVHINKPLASFTSSVVTGCEPLKVEFICPTPGVTQWLWLFGDGTLSTDPNPSHIYNQAGNYDVQLAVTDIYGCTDTLVKQNYIFVGIEDIQLNSQIINGCAPFSVQFSSPNSAGSHLWDFGDGTNSILENPTHTFYQPGVYTVSYSFSSSSVGECSQSIPVYATYVIGGGIAAYNSEHGVCEPYTANFTDLSLNAVAWLWNFGDGTTSTDQHPTHIYSNPGYYNVTLKITSADGCSRSVTKNNVVNFEPLIASPDAIPLNSSLPLNVQFLANSTGATIWNWDFGDGSSSVLENPIHTYTSSGPFNLSLIIANDTCSRTLSYPSITMGGGGTPLTGDSIIYTQSEPFIGCVPYTIEFNSPIKNAVGYLWLFGTGDSSISQNPTYVYEVPGLYDVILITIDSAGSSDTLINTGSVNLYGLSPQFATENILYCNNDSVIVTALDTTAGFYEWNFGDGFIASGITANHVYNQSDDYFISLRISDSLGCEVFSNQLYASGVQMQINSDKVNSCVEDTINFTSNSIQSFNYLWDFGDGNTSNQVNPQHAYSSGGDYSVTLHLVDSFGCLIPVTEIIKIIVHEPIADFSFKNRGNNCNQVLYSFTNNSQNAVTWHWQFGDGQTSNMENPSHHYTSFGNFDVSLTVTDFNCSSTITDSAAVVYKDVQVDFSFVQLDKCFPVEIQFQNLSQNAEFYSWQFGDGSVSSEMNPVHNYNSVLSDSIYLTVSDSFWCVKTIAKPIIDFMIPDFTVSKSEGCSPLEVSFANYSVGYDSITWIINDSIVSHQINPVLLLENEGYYDVTLLLHSNLGCIDTLKKDSLIYVSNPKASFTISDSVICKPAIVNFINQSENICDYIWNFGDATISVSENPVHIYNEEGDYGTSLIGISSLGCIDTFELNHPVTVRGPEANFFISIPDVCELRSIWFNDSSMLANFWFWDFGDGYTSALQHPVHQYAEDGTYYVSLIVSDSIGCTSVYEYPNGISITDHTTVNHSIDKTIGCTPLEISIAFPVIISDSILIDFGDGNFGTKNTGSHVYTESGIYQVKFIRINEWGCKDTTFSDSIIVIQQPTAKFKIENSIGCTPLTSNIIDLSNNLSNAQYNWNLGIANTTIDSSFQITYTNQGIYTISLIVVNEFLCSDTFEIKNAIQSFDNSVPAEVKMDFISVAFKDMVEIQWLKNIEPDIDYYNLYKRNLQSGLYDLIFSSKNEIKDLNTGSINRSNRGLHTDKYKYDYKVQAVNYCDNKIPLNDILPHNSILLHIDSVSSRGIYLSWNKYRQCYVSGYEIYRADLATGNYSIINTVNSNTLNYLDNDLACPQPYMYFVKAVNLCSTSYFSESNEVIAEPLLNLSNQKVELVRSTVVDDKFVLTEWLQPDLLPNLVVEYLIYRSTDNTNFRLIDRVSSFVTDFIDMDVAVDEEAYFYKIIPINICDVNAKESNNSSSILLQAATEGEITKLKWSKYTEWDSGVEKYVIERMDRNGNWRVIKEVDGNTYKYED